MPGLHIRYGPNQTGRLVLEEAFVVQDLTDSNVGNAQGAAVNKLLKNFLCSQGGDGSHTKVLFHP